MRQVALLVLALVCLTVQPPSMHRYVLQPSDDDPPDGKNPGSHAPMVPLPSVPKDDRWLPGMNPDGPEESPSLPELEDLNHAVARQPVLPALSLPATRRRPGSGL